MSDIHAAPVYGVVGQPLTQDYLARQFPIFQPKVPSTQATPLQFPTNAPVNLPLPPLYPGEVIKLQEHRVVCTDVFDEPAVGAVYVSNYRIIFHGNLISDPESLDALQDTNWKPQHLPKKEVDSTSSPMLYAKNNSRFKPFSSTKPEPSFKSFLMGNGHSHDPGDAAATAGDSPPQQQRSQQYGSLPRWHAQRFKSGFKKIRSLRLTSHDRPKFKHAATALSLDLSDEPDSAESVQGSIKEEVPTGGSKSKRKDIIFNYRQDTVSLDSVSVSSTSEFSATGTDDRSTTSPPREELSVPVDIVIGGDSGVDFSDPFSHSNGMGSISSYQSTADSGITVDKPFGKGSSTLKTGTGSSSGKGSSNAPTFGKRSPVQTSPVVNGSLSSKTTVNGNQVSDTDLEATLETTLVYGNDGSEGSGTLKSGSALFKAKSPSDVAGNGVPVVNGTSDLTNNRREDFASSFGSSETSELVQMRGKDQATHQYSNIRLLADWSAGLRGVGHSIKGVSRRRSKSNSSSTWKKPKPLPRKSLTRQVLTTDDDERSELFLASLPASFKPVPRPRHTPPGSNPNTPPTPKRRSKASVTPNDEPCPHPRSLMCKAPSSPRRTAPTSKALSNSPQHLSPVHLPPDQHLPRVSPPRTLKNSSTASQQVLPARSLKELSSGPPQSVLPPRTSKDTSPEYTPQEPDPSQHVSPLRTSKDTSPGHHQQPARTSSAPSRPARNTLRRRPPSPPQQMGTSRRRRPPTPPRLNSAPSTPLINPAGHEHSLSDPSTSQWESAPNSPLYTSSNSTLSSDVESSIGGRSTAADGGVNSDPIAPPRRRRRSKYNSQESSKDSLLSVDIMPVSPEEFPGQDRLPQSHDQVGKQERVGPATGHSSPRRESGTKNGSHDLEANVCPKSHDFEVIVSDASRDPGSAKSHCPDGDPNEEDLLSSPLLEEESADYFKDNGTPPPSSPFVGRNSHYSGGSSARTSRTSLTVFADTCSTPTLSVTTLRPYSFVGDTNHQFDFSVSYEKPPESYSGGHTLPKSVVTWGGRGKVLPNRQSLKGALMPASTRYSLCISFPLRSIHSIRKLASLSLKEYGVKLPEGVLVLCRTFQSMRLHIHPHNTYDADGMKELLERKFLADKPFHELFAFDYRAAIRHPNPTFLQNRSLPNHFRLSGEMERLGLQECKQWTVSRVLTNHPDLCPSYPSHLIVPTCTGDLDYIRGAKQYREGRFPTLTWYSRSTGAALLRAAGTHDGRGHSNMQEDEALLQSISGSKLDPKGPPMVIHVYTDKPESSLNERTAEQGRTYYYHNCKFKYGSNLPDYRTVRHSFNKLQAMLENALSDEDYLIALDTTRWLPRVADLLSTAYDISRSVMKEGAHALVCYEAGWDRTAQLVSLAQLLMDPYYRTMDGFQVLVQKEWVWFGHPFQLRHYRSGKSKEDGPVFLQWVDCVWQLMHQCPSAFEFNDRLLVSMVEHSYSGLFGTFMTNNEGARKQYFTEKNYEHMSVSTHTISFWTWVGMVNSSGRNFFNDLYDWTTYTGILKPNCEVPCLKLWTSHYCRCKPQENVYQCSILQAQLEELMKTYKKLEALYAELAPSSTKQDHSVFLGTTTTSTSSLPPPLGPRDEILANSFGDSVHREKPIPPPKPVAKTNSYETLKEFLEKEGFDTSICMHLELGPATCQGNLYKLGAVRKNWLQRWFVLDFNCQYFAYFENRTAYSSKDTPKGVIRLSDINRVFQDVKRKDHLMKNIFLLETPQRTYFIQAPTILSMYMWMKCLELPSLGGTVSNHAP